MKTETSQIKYFRIHAKKFYLTYSAVPSEMPPDAILYLLKKQIESLEYVIAEECHKDGKKYFHAIALSPKKLDVRSPNRFAVSFQGLQIRCNCQAVPNLTRTAEIIRYLCKGGLFLSNMKNFYEGVFYNYNELTLKKHEREGVTRTLQFIVDNFPQKVIGANGILQVERALKRIDKLKKQHVLEEEKKKMTPFKVKDFNLIPVIEQWIEDGFQPILIMVSPPGSGKTQFVKALAWEHGWNLFMVNHKEGIKDLNEEDTGIFFDDVSSEDLSRGIMLALIERDEDRTIRVLYGTVEKKKDFTQIFPLTKLRF